MADAQRIKYFQILMKLRITEFLGVAEYENDFKIKNLKWYNMANLKNKMSSNCNESLCS